MRGAGGRAAARVRRRFAQGAGGGGGICCRRASPPPATRPWLQRCPPVVSGCRRFAATAASTACLPGLLRPFQESSGDAAGDADGVVSGKDSDETGVRDKQQVFLVEGSSGKESVSGKGSVEIGVRDQQQDLVVLVVEEGSSCSGKEKSAWSRETAARMMAHVQQGQAVKALDVYYELRRKGTENKEIAVGAAPAAASIQEQEGGEEEDAVVVRRRVFVAALGACAAMGSLKDGKLIHGHILEQQQQQLQQQEEEEERKKRCLSDKVVGEALVDMYARCGSTDDARRVLLDDLPPPLRSDAAWTALITAHHHQGDTDGGVRLLGLMHSTGARPTQMALVRAAQACSSAGALDHGRLVHSLAARCGWTANNVFVATALIHMYAKCGALDCARAVFDALPAADVVAWTAMLAAYAQHGAGQAALALLAAMLAAGMPPDAVALVSALKACAGAGALDHGRLIHRAYAPPDSHRNVFLASVLVDMYAKCGALDDARAVFDAVAAARDAVTWNAMVAGYVAHGRPADALRLFRDMQAGGVRPNQVTLVSVLQACAAEAALEEGRLVHGHAREAGLVQASAFVHSALLDMYCTCGSLEDAQAAFDAAAAGGGSRDRVCWNALMGGYLQQGDAPGALRVLEHMQAGNVQPDRVTLISGLKACSCLAVAAAAVAEQDQQPQQQQQVGLELVRALRGLAHGDALLRGALSDLVASSAGVPMLADAGFASADACWDALVSATSSAAAAAATDKHSPPPLPPPQLLRALVTAAALRQGRALQALIQHRGDDSDVFVRSTLIDVYAKCGDLAAARRVFDTYPTRDLVAWNAMMAGYVAQGAGQEAIHLFHHMQAECIEPDAVTLLSALKACATAAALDLGRHLHARLAAAGHHHHLLLADPALCNSLVDMYAKCGALGDATAVFQRTPSKDVVTWNAMIGGHAQHGDARAALALFRDMQAAGTRPNAVTFVCLLSACSHTGMVAQGLALFAAMSADPFNVAPQVEHASCVVDLLGRAGRLADAERFVAALPPRLAAHTVRSLLGACREHGDLERGRRAYEAVLALDPRDSAAYVLMADLYGAAGRPGDADRVRAQMQSAGVSKLPGRTWVEAGGSAGVVAFTVEDKEHPQRREIYALLRLLLHMLPAAVVPTTLPPQPPPPVGDSALSAAFEPVTPVPAVDGPADDKEEEEQGCD